MTDNTQSKALRLADALDGNAKTAWTREEAAAELRRQHARIVELEAQLEAIGAGGVSPLIGQQASDSFSAADMATAAAQGFRDGVASVAAGAGSEPVAADQQPMPETWSVVASVHGERILSIGESWVSGKGELTEAETKAVIGMAQHLLSFVGYGLPPSSFDPDADDAALTHPSPPEGMVGGWMPIETAPKDGSEVLVNTTGIGLVVVYWSDDESQWGTGLGYLDGEAPTHWMPLPPSPTTSAGSGKGE